MTKKIGSTPRVKNHYHSCSARLKLSVCVKTSNDIMAGNGIILKDNMFIVWLYLFKKYIMSISFSFFF